MNQEERENSLKQLTLVHESNRDKGNTNWTVFSIFFAANAILLGAITNPKISLINWLIIPAFGIFLSFVWILLQVRITNFEKFYEKLQIDLEKKIYCDGIDLSKCECEFYKKYSVGQDNENYTKYMGGEFYSLFSAKNVMRAVPIILFIGGVFGMVTHLCNVDTMCLMMRHLS